jgi:hypothetical protein
LTAVKKMFVFAVKKIVIATIPTITGRLPTSPPLIASQRARAIDARLFSSVAAAAASGGAAVLRPAPRRPERRR